MHATGSPEPISETCTCAKRTHLAIERVFANIRSMLARCLAIVVLVGGVASSAAAEDYPVVDAPIPAFGIEVSARYVDEIPIVQDSIAAPWEPMKRLTGPRCGCDGIAVPDGW